MSDAQARWARRAVLFGLLLLGLYLRARHLDSHGLYTDEFGSAWAIHAESLSGVFERVYAIHGQSPLYYVLLRWVVSVLGETEVTLRLPSLVFGCALPFLGYAALARPTGRRAAVSATLMLTAHWLLVLQSHEARPYPLAEVLTLLAFWGASRSFVSGQLRHRVVMWGAAGLAIYAHYMFFALLPTLFVAAALARGPAYSRRQLTNDCLGAAAFVFPVLPHLVRLFARRDGLVWQNPVGLLESLNMILPGCQWVLAAAVAVYVWRRRKAGQDLWPRRFRPGEKGTLLLAGLCVAFVLGTILALYALATPISHPRYSTLGLFGAVVITARAVATLPRWGAVIALTFLCVQSFHIVQPDYGPQFGGAGEQLDALAPSADEPILLWSGFVESERICRPQSKHLLGFIASPLADRPGRKPASRPYLLLTRSWMADPLQPQYFETTLVPALEKAERFYLLAHSGYTVLFHEWLERRFPDAFEVTSESRSSFLLVRRYERRR